MGLQPDARILIRTSDDRERSCRGKRATLTRGQGDLTLVLPGSSTGDVTTIGPTIRIRGDVRILDDDLLLEGQIDGTLSAPEHAVWVDKQGRFTGEALARAVVVAGTFNGTVRASATIEVHETACVEGEIVAPEVSIAAGAQVRARLDTQRAEAALIVARHRLQQRGEHALDDLALPSQVSARAAHRLQPHGKKET